MTSSLLPCAMYVHERHCYVQFEDQNSEDICKCHSILLSANTEVLNTFFKKGGIQFILQVCGSVLVDIPQNIQAYSMKSSYTDDDFNIIVNLLICIKIILQTKEGIIALLTIDEALKSIIFALLPVDIDCILTVLDIFEIIIEKDNHIPISLFSQLIHNPNVDKVLDADGRECYELKCGTELIQQAVDSYRKQAREVIDFQSFSEFLEMSEDSELSYSILHFFNSMLQNVPTLENRLTVCSSFVFDSSS